MDYGQIQYQSSLIDIIYLYVFLEWYLEFYVSWSYHVLFSKNSKSHKITNWASIVMKIVTIEELWLLHWCIKFHIDISFRSYCCLKRWKSDKHARLKRSNFSDFEFFENCLKII